jgi:hypothetical protein
MRGAGCRVVSTAVHQVDGAHLIVCDAHTCRSCTDAGHKRSIGLHLLPEGGVKKACELLLQRLLPVEKQDTLAQLIQFLQL